MFQRRESEQSQPKRGRIRRRGTRHQQARGAKRSPLKREKDLKVGAKQREKAILTWKMTIQECVQKT